MTRPIRNASPASFDGRVAVVTGAGSGIGRAGAELLAARGARVVVADLRREAAEETVAAIRESGGEATAIAVDVADADAVRAMVALAVDTYGRLDLAHNNAGVPGSVGTPIHEYPEDAFDREIAVNLRGVFLCLKYELAHMRANGGGAIVNTASEAALRGGVSAAPYTAAKHGVVGLTRRAAVEAAQAGVRVNAVAPGLTHTAMTEHAPPELAEPIPLGRFADAIEIAETVAWLLSDASSFVTGQVLAADGGWSAN